MLILVISDIHANLNAFESVMEDAKGKWEKIWCLGDLVGYGPQPNECVSLIRQHDHISLSGNHDWAALGKLDINDFNEEARKAALWTRSVMSPETRDYLEALPAKRVIGEFTLAHASPRRPVWEYIIDYETALQNFSHFDTPTCLVGHTHVPILLAEKDEDEVAVFNPSYKETIFLEDSKVIINPGSVGQPRDSDPRAAYAILDTEALTWEFYRVAYPVEKTQKQIRDAGLPEPLAVRLAYGW